MPAFSIIMPTHNRGALLEVAIGSVLRQSHGDWELIVVDDGSDVAAGVPSDPRIRLLRNELAGGPAAARNIGIREATGDFIAFLDDDDAWGPRRLEHALHAHVGADLVVCGQQLFGGSEDAQDLAVVERRNPKRWILDSTTPSTGRVSIRRQLCPLFDENYRAAEDLDWWLRAAHAVNGLAWYTAPDWHWRRHDGLRGDVGIERRIEGSYRLMREHEAYFASHPRARAFRFRRLGIMHLQVGQNSTAVSAGFRSLAALPTWGGVRLILRAIGRSFRAHVALQLEGAHREEG